MSNSPIMATGGCLCKAVRYRVQGPLRDVIACHCTQCRRSSGHFVAATATRFENLVVTEDRGLCWYQPPDLYKRGFCKLCGSSLFFVSGTDAEDKISIAAGSLDDPVGIKLAAHIFVEEAGGYYEISDDVEQVSGGGHNVKIPNLTENLLTGLGYLSVRDLLMTYARIIRPLLDL